MSLFDSASLPLAVIDGLALAYRAFFGALASGNPDRFYSIYRKSILKYTANHDEVLFCFDCGDNFREDYYKGYKSERGERKVSHKEMRRLTRAFGYHVIHQPGLEADDIIYGVSKIRPCVIYTGDKDLLCCVSKTVSVVLLHNDSVRMDREAVIARWGVSPRKISDLLCLMGDSVDSFKGVAKVGPKKAAAILNRQTLAEALWEDPKLVDALPNLITSHILAHPFPFTPDLPADLKPGPADTKWLKKKGLSHLA